MRSKHTGVQKNPDSMTRKELVLCIKSFKEWSEAEQFWLKFALGKVSISAFYKARGY